MDEATWGAIQEYREEIISVQATGCIGAGSFRQVFRQMGYPHLVVMSDSSSAGDWWFLVSEDGVTWYNAGQENRWPHAGFEYNVDRDTWVVGTEEEAVEVMWELATS